MFVNLPYALASLRSVSAARLKAMYDAVAAVVNGNLGRENFALRGAIRVAQKAGPRSWVCLEAGLWHPFAGDGGYGAPGVAGSGPSVMRWKCPSIGPANRRPTVNVAHWTATVEGMPAGKYLTGGTVKLRHTPFATGVTADKDTYAIPNGIDVYQLFSRDVAEFVLNPGDTIEVQVTGATFAGGGTRLTGFRSAVWLKMDHLP